MSLQAKSHMRLVRSAKILPNGLGAPLTGVLFSFRDRLLRSSIFRVKSSGLKLFLANDSLMLLENDEPTVIRNSFRSGTILLSARNCCRLRLLSFWELFFWSTSCWECSSFRVKNFSLFSYSASHHRPPSSPGCSCHTSSPGSAQAWTVKTIPRKFHSPASCESARVRIRNFSAYLTDPDLH